MDNRLSALLNERWNSVWEANYNNKTDAAIDIDKLMKSNYKGHKYVPWAVMQKWFYLQDPYGSLKVIENVNGGLVHTDTAVIEEVKSDKGNETTLKRYAHSHFVKVEANFLGKVMIETYPIQDNSYGAPNYIDSNMVNKAIQRAKARLISMITGLGYQLYETGDLQFEEDLDTNAGKKTITKKATVVSKEEAPTKEAEVEVKKNTVSKKKVESVDGISPDIVEFADYLIENKDTILPIVQDLNKDIVKQYKKVIDLDDRDKTIDTLGNIKNIKIFSNAVKKRHEDLLEKGGK